MTTQEEPLLRQEVLGDPTAACVTLVGLLIFFLGLMFAGYLPASALYLYTPALFFAGIVEVVSGGLLVRKGEHITGMVFLVFGPLLLSIAVIALGLAHGWWIPAGPPAAATAATGSLDKVFGGYLISFTIVLSLWTFLSVVLPLIFTVILAPLSTALWLLAIADWNNSPAGLDKTAGWLLMITSVFCFYFMASAWLKWTGRDILPHGPSLLPPPRPAHTAGDGRATQTASGPSGVIT